MADYEIEIFVRKGLLRCSQEALRVHSEDRVKWRCNDNDFAIEFANHASPFGPQATSVSKKKGSSTDSFTVKKGRQLVERYKYAVSVHIPDNDHPILIVDPIIIVDDEG